MAKFRVLRPIEYSGKVYLPEAAGDTSISKSAGNGRDIPVDASGVIELSESQAAKLTFGQIEPIKAKVLSDREQGVGKKKSRSQIPAR